ncbi:MAG: archaeosortase/exosortase family protein [Rhodothermaceae bacterium]|nr:archaeosortase/exosortase family protein [Rhodothermaceae bacterium]
MPSVRTLLANNRALVRFVAIMVAAYLVWYVIYDLWLLPDGRLDEWLSIKVAGWTAGLINLFGGEAVHAERIVRMPGTLGIQLINGCNGLAVLSLFVGFVLAYPGSWARRAWFIPLGIVVVLGTNVVRCAVLLLLQRQSMEAFEAGHGGAGLVVFYFVVFLLWMVWARIGGGEAPRKKDPPPRLTTPEAVPA